MLAEMRENGESFYQFAERKSMEHRAYYAGRELSNECFNLFSHEAARSLAEQEQIESFDQIGFDQFLADYFAQS